MIKKRLSIVIFLLFAGFISGGKIFGTPVQVLLSEKEQEWIKSHQEITFGTSDTWAPFIIKGEQGNFYGIDPDIIKVINERTGLTIKMTAGKWSEMVAQAKERKIDGITTSAPLESRKDAFLFSMPYLIVNKKLFVLKNPNQKINSLFDLAGKKVGIEEGVAFDKELLKKIKGIKLLEYKNIYELMTGLEARQVDVIIGEERLQYLLAKTKNGEIKQVFQINEPHLKLVISIRKDWPELVSIVNKALSTLSLDDRHKIIQKWLAGIQGAESAQLKLTAEEVQFLREHHQVVIAPDPYFPPIEYFNDEGQYKGIAADFIKIMEDQLKIQFLVEKSETWDEVLLKARERKVDILPAAAVTPERQEYLNFTNPHLVFPGVIIGSNKSEKSLSMENLKGKRIGVVSGYVWHEFINRDYPDYNLVLVKDILEGLKEVSLGNLDVFIATLPVAVYYIDKEGISNLKVLGETGYYTRLAMGVRKDWPLLKSAIDKTLGSISESARKKIYQKWVSLKTESIWEKSEFWLIIIATFLALALIIAAIVVWNLTLKKQVAIKTAQLKQELSERERAEAALLKSEEQNRALLNLMPDMIFRIKTNGEILDYKGAERDLAMGREEMIGKNIMDTPLPEKVKKESLKLYQEVAHTNQMGMLEYQLILPEGVLDFEARVVKSGEDEVIAIVRNITNEKKMQSVLLQNEKMISIGRLAAGMAHEVNNPLGVVLQGIQNTLRRLSPELEQNRSVAEKKGIRLEQVVEYLKERKILSYLEGIRTAGTKAADIVANMLSFSRISKKEFEKQDIKKLIHISLELIENDYELLSHYDFKKIVVIEELEPEWTWVYCIATEIEQVLLNIFKNAAQAMEKSGNENPQLHIKTERKGTEGFIYIKDNGPGISEDVQQHIFEPFFTTKDVGQGTGLGLSVSYYIITENHSGKLWVESAPGQGATFIIQLPLGQK